MQFPCRAEQQPTCLLSAYWQKVFWGQQLVGEEVSVFFSPCSILVLVEYLGNLQASLADGTAAVGVVCRALGACGRGQVGLLVAVVCVGVDCCLESAFDVCLCKAEVDCEEERGDEGGY